MSEYLYIDDKKVKEFFVTGFAEYNNLPSDTRLFLDDAYDYLVTNDGIIYIHIYGISHDVSTRYYINHFRFLNEENVFIR